MLTKRRARLGLAAWCAGVALAVAAAVGAGPEVPLPPPSTHWARWWADAGPAGAIMAGVRLAVVVAGLWLLATTAAAIVSRRRRLAPRLLRRYVEAAFGVAVLGSVAFAGAAAAAPTLGKAPTLHLDGAAAPPPVLTWAAPNPAGPDSTSAGPAVPDPTTHDAPLAGAAAADPTGPGIASGPRRHATTATRRRARVGSAAAGPSRVTSSVPGAATYVVAPGDDLWSIAQRAVHRRGPSDSEAEVTRYWERLIAANRDVLPHPDVIFPGTALRLPVHAAGNVSGRLGRRR